ncbi:MAG: DUF4892 domain-containing protein, partial [Thermodesulfobacteriota bacterium]
MARWREALFAAFFMLTLSLSAHAVVGVKEHPLVKPYPGSRVWESKVVEFDSLTLPGGTSSYDASSRSYVYERSVKADGKVTVIRYRTPRERSGLEVLGNYREGLSKGGFEVVYSCYEGECGRGRLPKKYFQPSWGYANTGVITGRLVRPEGDVYVSVIVDQSNGYNTLVVVEARPMETGLVRVDADALLDDIERTGHASVYGIYFDTDSSEVKEESKQALGEIAGLLNKNPGLKLYVVGHTDNAGALDYNMGLSKRRAAAVVGVLTKDYGIAPKRLHAAGVGP